MSRRRPDTSVPKAAPRAGSKPARGAKKKVYGTAAQSAPTSVAPSTTRPPKKTRRRPVLRSFTLVTLVATVVYFGGTWVLHRSFFSVQQVVVLGNQHESAQAVVTRSGLDLHPAMIDVNGAGVSRSISALPWVDHVAVSRHWPHTVTLRVIERKPVAVAADASGNVWLVSRDGRRIGHAPVGTDLPHLVTTVAFTKWPFQSWGRNAAELADRHPVAFSSQVASITVDRGGRLQLRLTSPVSFVVGDLSQLHAKWIDVASVIAHQTLRAGDVVDVSTPSAVTIQGP